jgi:hypothetical protein
MCSFVFCLFSFVFFTISYCIFQFQWVKHARSDYGTQMVHIVFDWLLRTWKDIIFNFAIWLFVLVQTWIVKTILRHWWTFFSNIRQVRFVKKTATNCVICIVFMSFRYDVYILYILDILKYKKGMEKINYAGIAVYKNTLNK